MTTLPAVGVEDLAGHVGGVLRGEEDEAGGDLIGLAGPLHRHVLAERRDLVGREGRGDQRRPDRPGGDPVDADAALDQREGQRAGERDDGPLGRGVVEEHGVALVGGHRGRVDDRRALLEVRQRGLGHEELAEDVGPERALELLGGDLLDRILGVLLGGVVDQDLEMPELVHRLADGIAAEGFVADVAGDGQAAAALLLDPLAGLGGVLVLVQVDDGDVGALAGEGDGDGAADAAVAAGDEGHLPLELARAAAGTALRLGLGGPSPTRAGPVVLLLRRRLLGGHGSPPRRVGRIDGSGTGSNLFDPRPGRVPRTRALGVGATPHRPRSPFRTRAAGGVSTRPANRRANMVPDPRGTRRETAPGFPRRSTTRPAPGAAFADPRAGTRGTHLAFAGRPGWPSPSDSTDGSSSSRRQPQRPGHRLIPARSADAAVPTGGSHGPVLQHDPQFPRRPVPPPAPGPV